MTFSIRLLVGIISTYALCQKTLDFSIPCNNVLLLTLKELQAKCRQMQAEGCFLMHQ